MVWVSNPRYGLWERRRWSTPVALDDEPREGLVDSDFRFRPPSVTLGEATFHLAGYQEAKLDLHPKRISFDMTAHYPAKRLTPPTVHEGDLL